MTKFAKSMAAVAALTMIMPMAANAGLGSMMAGAKAKTTMKFDCTKAGNKNKAACKTKTGTVGNLPGTMPTGSHVANPPPLKGRMAAPAGKAGTVAYTTKSGKVIHYDCSKAGNKNKSACKGH